MKMKKLTCALLITSCGMLLASCGNDDSKTTSSDGTSQTNSTPRLESSAPSESVSQSSEEPAPEDDLDALVDRLCQSEYLTDAKGNSVPNPDYLPLPSFEKIPDNAVFAVSWDTTEGSYMAGTSFLMTTDLTEGPLLITAIHYFGEEDYIAGADLPAYVNGGDLYDILKDGSATDGSISSVIAIPDAVSYGAVNTCDKDLAAFTVENASNMSALPIASEPCQPGDMIYLAAYLSQEDTYVYDDCLYPCIVISDDGSEIYYVLSDIFLTGGASGAPLLNDKGEVVGIHIASDGSARYGHSAQSIYEQLQNALTAK